MNTKILKVLFLTNVLSKLIKQTFEQHFKPVKDLGISDWSESHVYLPAGTSAVPGRWRTIAYQKGVFEAIESPKTNKITLMFGAQLGKTSILNNSLGYYIQHQPESQIVMQPSESDVKTWLETKFNPMVDNCPSIRDCLAKPRGREGVNNQKMKSYHGGFLMLSWSGSPNTMRGRSAPKIYADEVDGYERTSEGHPVNLLWQRAATFGSKRKLLITSTPTHKGASFVEMSYLSGDQRQYYVPCPHCEEYQVLQWKNVTWHSDKGKHDTQSAYYTCEHCGSLINDGQKLAMIRKGEWQARMPFNGHASFHLNELYSPFRTFADIVQSFLEKKQTGDLKTFVNVSLAETWEEEGEQVEAGSLLARVEHWEVLPEGIVLITAGIDVQQDRIELQAVGWGVDEESWVIDYKIFHGETSEDEVWRELTQYLLHKRYQHESGKQLPIAFACLDTGGTNNMTSKAYDYVRRSRIGLPFAIKGRGGEYPFVAAPNRKRVPNKKAFDLYMIGTDEGKSILYNRLKLEEEKGASVIHFDANVCDARYFGQLTAEKRLLRYQKGFPKYEWHNVAADKRNEALDTYIYALAALRITNIDLSLKRQQLKQEAKTKPQKIANNKSFKL
ncbi:phage terminase large subunit family protein [Fastidiosibacter lacustris]|uniref:phage terminase large subunit family protein n=1 Tax=Fastidiosibacter lacustris TaxID=2056695 RepID=UPI000E34B94C|nr:phage terminase large subunit family protein [Fastidiosibacter lacustris]